MTKVVLTMIVKNEAHVILRALNSTLPLIDSYCIVDTGSTDNTKEIIKDFFNTHNIEGKLLDKEFTNFEECRNIALDGAKELGKYGFWIDADEELILEQNYNKQYFLDTLDKENPDMVFINCVYDNMNYQRGQIFNFDTNFYWNGPVHEYLKTDKTDLKTSLYKGFYCKIRPEGASWKTSLSQKYENHAKILLDYQEKNNWIDSRWTFYLANSYRDAALTILYQNMSDEKGIKLAKDAISYYKERITANNGFIDEVYFSQLMISKLTYFTQTNSSVLYELIKCEEYNIHNRCEHIYSIVSFLQKENLMKNAEIWAKLGLKKIKDGLKSTLFVERYIYDWALYDAYGTTIFYLGDYENSLKYTKYSLKNGNEKNTLPDTERKRIEDNIKSIETAISQRGN